MQDLEARKRLHTIELEIVNYFLSICEKNKLEYFMLGGTFLGAIRHKGFIPWDDDMDFGMPRKDYDELIEILSAKENKDFKFKNFRNSDIKTYFSRIESSKAQIIDTSAEKIDYRSAWIDIFPLDGMPNNKIIRTCHKLSLLYTRLLLQYSQFSEIVNINLKNRPLYEKILIYIGKIIKPEKYLNTKKIMWKLDGKLKKYSYEESNYVVNFMGAYKFREMFEKKIYENIVFYKFEHIDLKAPQDYDTILTSLYGDYMTPPKDKDKNKHFTKVEIK